MLAQKRYLVVGEAAFCLSLLVTMPRSGRGRDGRPDYHVRGMSLAEIEAVDRRREVVHEPVAAELAVAEYVEAELALPFEHPQDGAVLQFVKMGAPFFPM